MKYTIDIHYTYRPCHDRSHILRVYQKTMHTIARESIRTVVETLPEHILCFKRNSMKFISTVRTLDKHGRIDKVWRKSEDVDEKFKIFSASIYFTETTKIFKRSINYPVNNPRYSAFSL